MADLAFLPWKPLPLLAWANGFAPDWAHERIRSWDEASEPAKDVFALMFRAASRKRVRSVDLRGLVGQQGPFAGCSWLEALNSGVAEGFGVAREICLADAEPASFLGTDPPFKMHLVSYDEQHWYAEEGFHHALVAKFLHAYYGQQTGHHPLRHRVITLVHSIDWTTLHWFDTLTKLIAQSGLAITLCVRPGHLVSDINGEEEYAPARIVVGDARLCCGSAGDQRVLDPPAFQAYARWVVERKGQILWRDRARYCIGKRVSGAYDRFSLAIRRPGTPLSAKNPK